MSKVLIVDDSDPAIIYTGNWATLSSVGIQTNEYNGTVHQSSAVGDQLSYTFEGTGITVYGTLDAPGTQANLPNATFSIDGQPPTAVPSSFPGFDLGAISPYVRLYKSPSLTKGTHTLAISSGTPTNPAARLYIDFLTLDTGSDSASGNIAVDQRDTSITYVGNWHKSTNPFYFGITTIGDPSDVAGGTATFPFNGTSITVYGTTGLSGGANTTAAIMFTVDGGSSSQFYAPQNSNVIHHVPLFHVAGLSNTQEHSITMASLNTNRWWLEYIVYTTRNSSIAGAGGGGISVTGPEVGASGGGGGPNVGSVAGGVAAGVVVLLAIGGIIFILLRRHRHKSNEEFNDKRVTAGTGRHFGPSSFASPATGPHVHANALPNKQYGSNNFSGSALTGGAGGRVGRILLGSTVSSSFLGTQSPLSNLAPEMSQHSDGESQNIVSPAPGLSHGNANQNLHSQPYPSLDPGPEGGVGSMYQRNHRQDYDQASGRSSAPKALYTYGSPTSLVTPAVIHPPPSTVQTEEEDSGIRIPARPPPVYTAK